jgi:hypothetical protein
MYYRNAQAAVVVYDVTKASSLEKAKSWVKELQRQANPNIVIALAGNKVDLVLPSPSTSGANSSSESEDEADDATATPGETPGADSQPESLRQVPREEAQAYAAEANLLFFETSAKTGEGVVEIFTEIGSYCPYLKCRRLLNVGLSQEDSYRTHTGICTRWCRSPRCCRCSSRSTARRCQSRRESSKRQRCLQLLRKLARAHTHMMVCPLVYYDYALLRVHLLHCYFPSLFHGILLVICSLIFYHDKGRSC